MERPQLRHGRHRLRLHQPDRHHPRAEKPQPLLLSHPPPGQPKEGTIRELKSRTRLRTTAVDAMRWVSWEREAALSLACRAPKWEHVCRTMARVACGDTISSLRDRSKSGSGHRRIRRTL